MNISRRTFLTGAGAAAASALALNAARSYDEAALRADVFIAQASSYEVDLEAVIRRGLEELGLGSSTIKGKVVLLKPNLVEPTRSEPQINTHPGLVRAAAEVFRRWQAREVLVAEGQGHCRDTLYVLDQSGLAPMLAAAKLPFVDLNHDDVYTATNTLGYTRLRELMLPLTLRRADVIVSMPKMKTHHWAGVTLSMKNLFGVLPGVCYGWPKNVLHHQGIHQSILDINATVRPHLAIVDGIIGMEGDGPIMGTPKASGVVVMGTNLPAVDATCARLMAIDPSRVGYLAAASGRLGPISEIHITQRGEALAPLVQSYQLLDDPSLSGLRA
ncbi:MAG TPA: DUF362 domain-containing protein [Isosphaeraceae bacterium]|nr:DUF362 domain-containing protein [Isosphaeraceae bacterium]